MANKNVFVMKPQKKVISKSEAHGKPQKKREAPMIWLDESTSIPYFLILKMYQSCVSEFRLECFGGQQKICEFDEIWGGKMQKCKAPTSEKKSWLNFLFYRQIIYIFFVISI